MHAYEKVDRFKNRIRIKNLSVFSLRHSRMAKCSGGKCFVSTSR